MPLGERIANIDKNIASVRLDKNKFFDLIVDAGYVADDGSADVKKFNRAAKRAGIDVKDRSPANLKRITKFLNLKSGGAYKNVGMFSAKSLAENAASQSEGFLGEYAEQYSAATKEEFWDDAKKIQRKVNKLKISSANKVKKIAQGLKLKWAVPIGVTSTLLTKMGFGAVGHLMTTEMGDAELPKESMADQAVKNIDFSGPSANAQLLEQLSQDAVMNKRGGGMMNINRMTAPLGYAAGGPAPKESGGLQPPTGLSKWYADKFPVDPIHQMKENLIDKGKRTVKGIGKGLGELFVAKPAGAEEGNLMDSIINLFMMNELTKEGIDWDDDDDLLAKYFDKFGDPFENIKIKKPE